MDIAIILRLYLDFFEKIIGFNLEKRIAVNGSIETMKNDMEKIEWKFKKELDDYDDKVTNKLKNSLEMIDQETSKIIKDLKDFKEL